MFYTYGQYWKDPIDPLSILLLLLLSVIGHTCPKICINWVSVASEINKIKPEKDFKLYAIGVKETALIGSLELQKSLKLSLKEMCRPRCLVDTVYPIIPSKRYILVVLYGSN